MIGAANAYDTFEDKSPRKTDSGVGAMNEDPGANVAITKPVPACVRHVSIYQSGPTAIIIQANE